jgi:polyphosphate kinase 2
LTKKEKTEQVKLSEQRALKNKDKKPSKDRVAVWVKKKTVAYEQELHDLQVELLKLQQHIKNKGLRMVILFEGRDAAGKGGLIKRFTEHINPRGIRVVALGVPSDRERSQWYFQRYVEHLPSAGEIVFFDRSWYNRAMVEPVMGFCTDEQNKRFLKDVPLFEQMLVKDGIKLFKFYLSISKEEQLRRFNSRRGNLLKRYKYSVVDDQAQEMWSQYTVRKFQMLNESNRTLAPWHIIRTDSKKEARINAIKVVLEALDYENQIKPAALAPDPEVVISGIDELRHMEDNLRNPGSLPG